MAKKQKVRQSLEAILVSCSDTLYPAQMGEAPVTLHSCDVDGDTPLHVMLWRGDTYAVRALIDAGADVDAVGDMSEVPLHVAIRQGNVAAVKALLAAGARATFMSEFGQTPSGMAHKVGGDMKRLFLNA